MSADFVAGDTSVLKVTCRDKETRQIIPNLNLATSIKLRYRIADGELRIRDMTVVDSAAGLVKYQFDIDELQAGLFRGEVRIVDAANKPLTNLDPVILTVREPV